MEKRNKVDKKDKIAYIAWDQNSESSALSCSRFEEEVNLYLMADTNDAFSVHITDTESVSQASPDIDQLVEAFNDMHQEAQKLAISNNRLKSTAKYQYEKIVSIQAKLNDLKPEYEKVMRTFEISSCVCEKGLDNATKYKQLERLYETFKKVHFDECFQLQTEIAYYKDLLTKAYKGNMILKEILSLQRIAIDKIGLG